MAHGWTQSDNWDGTARGPVSSTRLRRMDEGPIGRRRTSGGWKIQIRCSLPQTKAEGMVCVPCCTCSTR